VNILDGSDTYFGSENVSAQTMQRFCVVELHGSFSLVKEMKKLESALGIRK